MQVLTPVEAAQFLKISRSMLDSLKRKKLLEGTYYCVGVRVLFIESKLREWAETGGTLNKKDVS